MINKKNLKSKDVLSFYSNGVTSFLVPSELHQEGFSMSNSVHLCFKIKCWANLSKNLSESYLVIDLLY